MYGFVDAQSFALRPRHLELSNIFWDKFSVTFKKASGYAAAIRETVGL